MRDFLRRNHFLLRRLHSLSGIVPVGGFMLFHLYENSKVLNGAAAYNDTVIAVNSMHMILLLEIFVIMVPLYFHALYGVYIALDAKHNVSNYGYGRNWAFFFQRITGLITFAFVTWHIWEFRIQKSLGAFDALPGADAAMKGLPSYQVLVDAFANPLNKAWYIIGIVAAAYHLCNGVYTFLITWGITIGPKSQRVSSLITNAVFVAVSALGIITLFAFK